MANYVKFKQGLNKAISIYTAAQTEAGIEAHQGIDDFIISGDCGFYYFLS